MQGPRRAPTRVCPARSHRDLIPGDQQIGKGDFGALEVDEHTDGASLEGAIFSGSHYFTIDGKGKGAAISEDFDRIDTLRGMTLVKFFAKGLVPEQGPGVDRGTFAVVILVKSIFPVIGIQHFKAIEGIDDLVAFGLLAIADNHAKGVINRGIISFDLLHG